MALTGCPKEERQSLPPIRSAGAEPKPKASLKAEPAPTPKGKPAPQATPPPNPKPPPRTAPSPTGKRVLAHAPVAAQRYPSTRTLSPLTSVVAANIQAIAGRNIGLRDDTFMKVGASGSAAPFLLKCLATSDVVLGDFNHLENTLRALRLSRATPLERDSLAAKPGKTARWAITGDRDRLSPLEKEIEATKGRFALVHYGTNDMHMAGTFADALHPFARNLLRIVDGLTSKGIIPSLGTLSPRLDRKDANFWVPTYNQVVRAIAQARSVPLLDMHTAMLALPNHGRAADNLHANVYRSKSAARPCVFTEKGLQYAYNVRNYLSLKLIDQMRRILRREEYDDEEADPILLGEGSAAGPYRVDALPFADLRDIRRSRHMALNLTTCAAGKPPAKTGPEVVYELTLKKPSRLRIVAVNLLETDVDLYLMPGKGDACYRHAGQHVEGKFPAGTVRIAVDTRLLGDTPKWGEFALTIVECDAEDAACDTPAW